MVGRLGLSLLIVAVAAAGGGCGEAEAILHEIAEHHHHPPPPPPPEVTVDLQLSGTNDTPGVNDDFVVVSAASGERPFASLSVAAAGAAGAPAVQVELSASGGGAVTLDPEVVTVAPGERAEVKVFGDRASAAVDDVVIVARVAGGTQEAREDLTVIDGVSLVFSGNFQDRLATDPDPPTDPRGTNGSTRALAGEANLDGIIRFSDPVDRRLFCGFDPVQVRAVRALQPPGAEFVGGDPAIGMPIRLGPASRFVDPQGDLSRERIDGFELHVADLDAAGVPPIGGPVSLIPVSERGPILDDYRNREGLLQAERARRDAGDIELGRIDARLALRATFQYDRWQLLFTRSFCDGATPLAPAGPRSQLATLLAAGLDYRIDFFGFDADCLTGRIKGVLRPTAAAAPPLCAPGAF